MYKLSIIVAMALHETDSGIPDFTIAVHWEMSDEAQRSATAIMVTFSVLWQTACIENIVSQCLLNIPRMMNWTMIDSSDHDEPYFTIESYTKEAPLVLSLTLMHD